MVEKIEVVRWSNRWKIQPHGGLHHIAPPFRSQYTRFGLKPILIKKFDDLVKIHFYAKPPGVETKTCLY